MNRHQVKWLPCAERLLENLPLAVQREAVDLARSLGAEPFPDGSRALGERGMGYQRIHVGPGHRMIYKVTARFVIIVRVDDRGNVYSGFEGL